MSITYPSSPPFRAIGLRTKDPTVQFRAQNGIRIARKADGHYWRFTLTYPPLTKAAFGPVMGAIMKARGSYQTFTVTPPNLAAPLGTQTADTAVATNTAAGSSSVPISGAGVGATFKAGDVLKFSNHNKVYMLTDDTTADGSGLGTLSFSPPLVSAVTTSHTVKHSSVPFTVAMTNDLQEIQTAVHGLVTYELDVEEVFA